MNEEIKTCLPVGLCATQKDNCEVGGMAVERVARTGLFKEVTSWSQSSSAEGFHPMGLDWKLLKAPVKVVIF